MTTPIEPEAPPPVPGNYPRLMWDTDGTEFTVFAPSEFTAAASDGAVEAPPEPPEINPEEPAPEEVPPESRTTWRRPHRRK